MTRPVIGEGKQRYKQIENSTAHALCLSVCLSDTVIISMGIWPVFKYLLGWILGPKQILQGRGIRLDGCRG